VDCHSVCQGPAHPCLRPAAAWATRKLASSSSMTCRAQALCSTPAGDQGGGWARTQGWSRQQLDVGVELAGQEGLRL
jgi:hypothetical protein